MMEAILLPAVLFLAYANGANDNFKGVATLFGSGTTGYRGAISWATATTFAGSLAAVFLAGELVKNFSGKGLVPDEMLSDTAFAAAVAGGAAVTILFATRIGMPVSTTHALVGALTGAGVMAAGTAFGFLKLGGAFLLPLLLSPLAAAVAGFAAYPLLRRLRMASGISSDTCLCAGSGKVAVSAVQAGGNTAVYSLRSGSTLTVSDRAECTPAYSGRILGIDAQSVLDAAHYLSAGAVSFARGLNDTPKIAGLLLVVPVCGSHWGLVAIAAAIAAGGLLNARKVGETMSRKITRMNHGQGLTANLATALLVTTASLHGLPASTTHVSVGSLSGVGAVSGGLNRKMLAGIMLAWLLTLPAAALAGAGIFILLAP